MRDALSDSEKFAIVALYELLERRNISILGGMDKVQIIVCPFAHCELSRVFSHICAPDGKALFRDTLPMPSRNLRSLHHDFAGHLRVDRAVVGIRSRLGKRV